MRARTIFAGSEEIRAEKGKKEKKETSRNAESAAKPGESSYG